MVAKLFRYKYLLITPLTKPVDISLGLSKLCKLASQFGCCESNKFENLSLLHIVSLVRMVLPLRILGSNVQINYYIFR
jgi:hypothetical protein